MKIESHLDFCSLVKSHFHGKCGGIICKLAYLWWWPWTNRCTDGKTTGVQTKATFIILSARKINVKKRFFNMCMNYLAKQGALNFNYRKVQFIKIFRTLLSLVLIDHLYWPPYIYIYIYIYMIWYASWQTSHIFQRSTPKHSSLSYDNRWLICQNATTVN